MKRVHHLIDQIEAEIASTIMGGAQYIDMRPIRDRIGQINELLHAHLHTLLASPPDAETALIILEDVQAIQKRLATICDPRYISSLQG